MEVLHEKPSFVKNIR